MGLPEVTALESLLISTLERLEWRAFTFSSRAMVLSWPHMVIVSVLPWCFTVTVTRREGGGAQPSLMGCGRGSLGGMHGGGMIEGVTIGRMIGGGGILVV